MAVTNENDNDIMHRLRNHIQIVDGLLRLHSDHAEAANALELFKKLRTRLAAVEETSFPTLASPRGPAAVRPVIEAIAEAVGRIYGDHGKHRCVVEGGDFRLEAVELALVGQIFAEYLSTIYAARAPREAASRVVATIDRGANGVVTMAVRDPDFAAGQHAAPVDPLTVKMVSALVGGINGEARYDREAVFDARLVFTARAEAPTP